MAHPSVSFAIAPYDYAAAERLQAELGVSQVLAQVLVRRGHADPAAARAFLAGRTAIRSPPSAGSPTQRR